MALCTLRGPGGRGAEGWLEYDTHPISSDKGLVTDQGGTLLGGVAGDQTAAWRRGTAADQEGGVCQRGSHTAGRERRDSVRPQRASAVC